MEAAWLDSWSAVCDTLTFYGERQANEAYLGTATERESLRAHARLIGYELAPAKAAAVHLAFTAEENDAPEENLEYEAGLQARSIPRDGEIPQIFETIEPLTARANWNDLRPRMSYPQELAEDTGKVRLAAGGPGVDVGDPVLFLRGNVPVPDADEGHFLRIVNTTKDLGAGETNIELSAQPTSPPSYSFVFLSAALAWNFSTPLTTAALTTEVLSSSWSTSAMSTTASFNAVSYQVLSLAIQALTIELSDPIEPARMRVKAGCFGNNAVVKRTPLSEVSIPELPAPPTNPTAPIPASITATKGHVDDGLQTTNTVHIFLDREYDEIVPGQYVLLRDAQREGISEVHSVDTMSVEAYGLSGKVTRLEIDAQLATADSTISASLFQTRRTTVYAAPENLPLAALPIDTNVGESHGDLGADQVELGTAEIGLLPGKTVILTGERADLDGITASEVLTVADNTLNGGFSVLTFEKEPIHSYKRATVTLNANVAQATHGETVTEILGDGDAAKPFATYALKSKPLTHVSAKTSSGMAPALEVRVDGVVWDLVDDFRDAGPEDRVCLLRIDENETARVVFGDGFQGQRCATGLDNVEATYRKGAGSDGMLEAGQISLLATKPQGLKGVINPLVPAAAADGESIEDARRNAPLQVLTLGRVVSLRDYEDFARGFAAIAKARADWTFDGFQRPIFVTVAGQGGMLLPEAGDDMVNLLSELRRAGEADIRVSVRNYRPATFAVEARLFADPAYRSDDVKAAANDALALAFSFDARALGQPVSRGQVIAALQAVDGVVGVDVDSFYRTGNTPSLEVRLGSAAAAPSLDGAIPEAAELLTIDMAATRLEVVA